MADIIDLLTSADFNTKDNIASKLTSKLNETTSAEGLLNWFHATTDPISGELFTEVSLDDCERIIKSKANLMKYGELLVRENGY